MKKAFLLVTALLLLASTAFATATTLKWTAGWDNSNEPLNYSKSKISYSVNSATKKLSVKFTLVGARSSKLYQVAVAIFCTTFPPTFGQFPNDLAGGGNCVSATRQGVTRTLTSVEFGVVTTDIHGNGSLAVVVGPVAPGTYEVEFFGRDGAGCFLSGGAGQGSDCLGDFQSPGPIYGDSTTITIP